MKISVFVHCFSLFTAASVDVISTNNAVVSSGGGGEDGSTSTMSSPTPSSSLTPSLSQSSLQMIGDEVNLQLALPEIWLSAYSDCTIQVVYLLPISGAEESLTANEEFVCDIDPTDAPGGYSGLTRKLGLSDEQRLSLENMLMDGSLIPGESKLVISGMTGGMQFNSQEIQVPKELHVLEHVVFVDSQQPLNSSNGIDEKLLFSDNKDEKPNDDHGGDQHPRNSLFKRRELVSFGSHTGNKPMLVVKVTAANGARPETPAVISDDVFGTSGDAVTLKSQLNACSMGRLTVIPGDNNSGQINQSVYSAPGVISVTIDEYISSGNRLAVENAVKIAVQKKLGVTLPGPYKNVIFVLGNCADCTWAAYGYLNGWLTVYQGANYKYVGVLVHEIGHNYGLVSIQCTCCNLLIDEGFIFSVH